VIEPFVRTGTVVVAEADCATRWGNEGLLAFSTPAMLGHMERVCVEALAPLLPAGAMTVGTSATLRHLAPTPAGAEVRIRVRLVEPGDRRLVFAFEADDPWGRVGEGVHERYVVDEASFRERLGSKGEELGRLPGPGPGDGPQPVARGR
jgi:fluoroacetyl-CoA thioesterase